MKLETDRLYLEILDEIHFPIFLPLDMDPDVMKFIRKEAENEEVARANFQRYLNYQQKFPGFGAFSVFEKASGEFVGVGVLVHIELKPEYGKIEVGYRLAKSAWGKGYATEVAKCLIEYGFNHLGMNEIFGTTHPDHVVSQKTLKKAGLTEIGTGPYHGGCKMFLISKN